MRKLKEGDRVRAKVRTISGWKGKGTVEWDQRYDTVTFRQDKHGRGDGERCDMMRYQVAKLRDQTQ